MPDMPDLDRTGQDLIKLNRPEQDRTGQDRMDRRTRHGNARHDIREYLQGETARDGAVRCGAVTQ